MVILSVSSLLLEAPARLSQTIETLVSDVLKRNVGGFESCGFQVSHLSSPFIFHHLSSFIILSLVLEDRSQDLLDDFLDHFRHVLFRGREGFAVKKLFSSKVSTPLSDTLSRKVDAKQKVSKTYDF